MIKENYTPYPHFEISDLIGQNDLAKIHLSLKSSKKWVYHSEYFFSQYEDSSIVFDNNDLLKIFTVQLIEKIISYFEYFFCVSLKRDKYKITSHKIVSGQSIGLHNDAPYDELETHRFIMTFCENYEDSFGGHFLMFRGNKLSDISKIVRPINGLGIGIPLSEISYHAVNMVNGWERYSIVFSFWEENYYQNKHSRIINLKNSGASEFTHSGRNLFTHLFNTFQILQSWGCSAEVSLAGLYHSIYGTRRIEIPPLKKDFYLGLEVDLTAQVKDLIISYSETQTSDILRGIEILKKDKENKVDELSKQINLILIDIANTVEQSELFDVRQFKRDIYQYLPTFELLPDKVKRIITSIE
jgi:hypothetical protein